MKKYIVIMHYEGAIDYTVNANSEDEAEAIAEELFKNENPITIVSEIEDAFVCDCRKE